MACSHVATLFWRQGIKARLCVFLPCHDELPLPVITAAGRTVVEPLERPTVPMPFPVFR